MDVEIRTILHKNQRYDTAGDWQFDHLKNRLVISVSDLKSWRLEALLGVHELVEAILCQAEGVPQEAVDDFDFGCKDGEPGDSPKAPYHSQHKFALKIERQLARRLGVNWRVYEKLLDGLYWPEKEQHRGNEAE